MANPTTLYEYFSAKGQTLPSLSERAKLYESLGLGSASNYVGTGDQNTALLGKLATTQPVTAVKPTAETATYPKTSEGLVPVMPSGAPIPKPIVTEGGATPPKTVNVQGFTIDTKTGEPIDPKTGKPLTAVTGQTYTVKSGDTLSAIAAKYGVPISSITGYRSGDPNLIYPGETLTIGGAKATAQPTLESIATGLAGVGTGIASLKERIATEGITGPGGVVLQAPTKGVVTSEVPRTEEAKTIAETAAKEVAEEKEITTLQRQRTIAELKKELGIDTGIPVRPTFATDFEALRSEEGMSALEGQINSLETQIRDTEASLRQGLYTEEGQLRPMELIGTRQRELTRQAQEQMDTLNRRKTTLVDEYNTKVDLVNNIMKLKTMDYANAVDEYNTKFSQAIQMQNLLMSMEEKEKSEDTAMRDDARANLTLILNQAKEAGRTFSELDPSMQLTIKKLELQAAMPVGVTEFFLSNKPDAEVLAHVTGTDATGNDIITFVYKDADGKPGTTEIVYTGGVSLPAGVSSATADDMNRVNVTNEFINKNVGEDQLISAETWLQARMQWAAMNGTPSQFDDLYNPALLMGDWEWKKLPLDMQPKGEASQFLTKDYFTNTFTDSQIDKGAKVAGYKSWTGRVGEEHRQEYITYLIEKYIPQQRLAGYSDQDILASITKTME